VIRYAIGRFDLRQMDGPVRSGPIPRRIKPDRVSRVPNRKTGLADARQGWGREIPHVMKRKKEVGLVRGSGLRGNVWKALA